LLVRVLSLITASLLGDANIAAVTFIQTRANYPNWRESIKWCCGTTGHTLLLTIKAPLCLFMRMASSILFLFAVSNTGVVSGTTYSVLLYYVAQPLSFDNAA